jgi:hypothetical protein
MHVGAGFGHVFISWAHERKGYQNETIAADLANAGSDAQYTCVVPSGFAYLHFALRLRSHRVELIVEEKLQRCEG